MLPVPAAGKLPTRAMNAPKLSPASVPLIEKAYVPLRLELEKPPVTGGGTDGALLLLLHAAAKRATTAATTNASGFKRHLPVPCPHLGQGGAGSRPYCAAPTFDCPSGGCAQRIERPCRTQRFRQSHGCCHPRQGLGDSLPAVWHLRDERRFGQRRSGPPRAGPREEPTSSPRN